MNKITTYYKLVNTVSEYNSIVTYRNSRFSKVKEEMKNHSDWWCDKGTGRIYQINIIEDADGNIKIKKTKVFEKTNVGVIYAMPGIEEGE